MKKFVFLVLVIGAAGAFAWHSYLRPEVRTCRKLSTLCGEKAETADCVTDMADLRRQLGEEGTERLDRCVAEARSCPEASGCMVGAGAGAIGEAVGDFLKGLGKALEKK